jgi:hypothetical protein
LALRILIWSILFGWINSLTKYVLMALDRQRQVMLASGARVAHFEYTDDQAEGYATAVSRHWPVLGDIAQIMRGPVWTHGQSIGAHASGLARQMRRDRRGVVLMMDQVGGRDPLAGQGLISLYSPATQARLSLSKDFAAMRANMHGKWRNRLRRAEAEALVVDHAPLPDDPAHWLLLEEAQQAQAKGYRGLPSTFSHVWRVLNGAKSTRLFVAKERKQAVSAVLVLLHGKTATYQIGWSNTRGRMLNAQNLAMWCAVCWLAERGYRWLDLGAIDTETSPGLARFKLGLGAQAQTLSSTWLDAPGTRLVSALTGGRIRSRPYPTMPGSGQPAE